MIGVGIAVIIGRSNKGFTQVRIQTDGSVKEGPPSEKVEDKKVDANKKVVARKVPLESVTIPEGFPSEVVFYFGSQTGTAEKQCIILE